MVAEVLFQEMAFASGVLEMVVEDHPVLRHIPAKEFGENRLVVKMS